MKEKKKKGGKKERRTKLKFTFDFLEDAILNQSNPSLSNATMLLYSLIENVCKF